MITIGDRVKYIGDNLMEKSRLRKIEGNTYNVIADETTNLYKIGDRKNYVIVWKDNVKKVNKKIKRLN